MTAAYHAHLPCPQSLVLASRACTRVRWNNSWTTEHHGVHPSASFSPLFWSLTPSSFTSPPLHSSPRARLPSLFYSLRPSRFSIRKKKKKTNIAQPSTRTRTLHILFLFSPLPFRSSVNNSERKPKILKFEKLGRVSSFFLFLFFLKHREPLCQSSTSDFKKLLMMERGVGEREGRICDIVPREKKVLNLSLWKWRGSRAI